MCMVLTMHNRDKTMMNKYLLFILVRLFLYVFLYDWLDACVFDWFDVCVCVPGGGWVAVETRR